MPTTDRTIKKIICTPSKELRALFLDIRPLRLTPMHKIFRAVALTVFALGCSAAIPIPALADEIFGRIWNGSNKAPFNGAEVRADCSHPGTSSLSARTSAQGFYRINVAHGATCTISIVYGGRSSSALRIYSEGRRTAVDIEARQQGNRWLLIRR